MSHSFRVAALLLLAALQSSCGGGGSIDNGVTITLAHRIAAAEQTADQHSTCQLASPFYFEIGDAPGALVGGSVGGSTYTATTLMSIASGTKWLFGAYVAEVRAGVLSIDDRRATRMQSGYVSMGNICGAATTVAACFQSSANDTFTPSSVDRFHYNGGHFQKWGVDNGFGTMDAAQVASEFQSVLGSDIPIGFISPLLAGGAAMSADGYAIFLRKILNHQLRISALLGADKVCTLPGTCADADSSPIPDAWSYGAGHWIEDDGSFSSPGAFGFYPWIDETKTYYGILARQDVSAGATTVSIACGQHIRAAFLSGVAQ